MQEKCGNRLVLGPDCIVDALKLSNQAPRVSGESLQTWRCPDGTQHLFRWFIVYKIPAIEKEKKGSPLRSGLSYAYITSKDPEKWVLSSRSVESKKSILGINLEQSKKKSEKNSTLSHLFYSDDPPLQYHKRLKKHIGHLKGYLAFDSETGIWLTHSIPKYTKIDKYEFPPNAIASGHMAMCITLSTENLSSIC
ncbi:cell death-related nuclease 6 [Trichonephila clavipes]|nr:cell death-related nuclease 6 [Trichonephila clavipes]